MATRTRTPHARLDEFLARARSGPGQGTVYDSPGVMPAFDLDAWPRGARNDCSGFLSWCLRFSASRRVPHPLYLCVNDGWFDTTAIHADGSRPNGYFTRLERARPGALLVYPDYRKPGGWSDGHVGIVLAASGAGVAGVTEVVHCFKPGRRGEDAVAITGPERWVERPESIIVWFDGLGGCGDFDLPGVRRRRRSA